MFDMLKLVSSIYLSFHHHMKSTSSSQHTIVVSLLSEGYSVHQIQSKTGLGKSTVGRIKKEMDSDKENSKGGCPSKLSHHDKQSIIHQITTGKLDNAVQAT
jgi:transposase